MRRITELQASRIRKPDPRVQAIRCKHCNRLRQHPRTDDWKSFYCGCGSMQFVASFPHPDEEQLALKLYSRELEEKNTYSALAEELLDEWSVGQGRPPESNKIIIV